MRVTIVGLGYVGLTTAVALAYLGNHVTGVEKDKGKLDALRAGRAPFYEPGLAELLGLVKKIFPSHQILKRPWAMRSS